MKYSRGTLSDFIEFNPRESLPKGNVAKEIAMADLIPFQKKISNYNISPYKGGMKFRNGDTLLARITPCLENGKTAYVDILNEDEVGFGSTEYIVLRAIPQKTIPEFVFYFAISDWFRKRAIALMTGSSGRQRVQTDKLMDLEVIMPDLETQKKIVRILSALDQRIELNNNMSNVLRQISKALYHDCMDKYKNEIKYKSISELSDKVITGKTPSTAIEEYWNGNIPFITIPDMHNQIFITKTERYISESGCRSFIPENSISVSCIATVGLVSISTRKSQTNQQINSIVLKNSDSLFFVFEYLSEQEQYLKNIASGSTTYNINKGTFEKIMVPCLSEEHTKRYNKTVSKLFAKILNYQYENENLTILRDTLLPKLLSGEIDSENCIAQTNKSTNCYK